MIHIPNERYEKLTKFATTKIASAEYKASHNGSPSCARIELQFCALPGHFLGPCPFAYIIVRMSKFRKKIADYIKAPPSEIISVRMEFTSQVIEKKHMSGKRKNIFEIAAIDVGCSRSQDPLKSAHNYAFDLSLHSPRFVVGIRAPLRYSLSKFNTMMKNTIVYVYIQMRQLRRVEISPDYLYFRATVRPEKIWLRHFIIKESNTALQQFIENAKTNDEILAKVNDGTLCVYYDAQPDKLLDAITSIMSVVYAPNGFTLENRVTPKETLTEKYIYYTQVNEVLIMRCDDANRIASLVYPTIVKNIGCCHGEILYKTGICDKIDICVGYFCDGAFPFNQFTFKQSLAFP